MSHYDPELADATKSKEKTEQPPRFRVMLHNDDYTPMDLVVDVLIQVFQYSEDDAVRLTVKVHHSGIGVVGVYPFEIAETKALKGIKMAQQRGYPLLLSVEPESTL